MGYEVFTDNTGDIHVCWIGTEKEVLLHKGMPTKYSVEPNASGTIETGYFNLVSVLLLNSHKTDTV